MEDKREINAMWLTGSMGSVEEACERIKQLHDWDKQTISGLKNRVKELEDIHYKDNLVKQMQDKVYQMEHDYHQGFPISDEEKKSISIWQQQHIKTFHNNKLPTGVSGGNWIYQFIPTSIGTVKTCTCSICKNKAQITAFENEENWNDNEVANKYIKLFDTTFDFSDGM